MGGTKRAVWRVVDEDAQRRDCHAEARRRHEGVEGAAAQHADAPVRRRALVAEVTKPHPIGDRPAVWDRGAS